MNPRERCIDVLLNVFVNGQSLTEAFNQLNWPADQAADLALLKHLCFGICRFYPRLDYLARRCLRKPMKAADRDIELIIYLGLYQLLYSRIPEHAAVAETVALTKLRGKRWATGVVNAILRRFIREADDLLATVPGDLSAHYAHPAWLIKQIRQAWPKHWQQILNANNEEPPLTVRVNLQTHSRDDFIAACQSQNLSAETVEHCPSAVNILDKVNVEAIPGFADGWVSVQDAGAQWCAHLLSPQRGERILDACAAPGGKTCHLLEKANDIECVALDIDPQRAQRIDENLQRCHLQANITIADATDLASWWDKQAFDRILLDAPCSATGVIRRHPDIKALRRQSDILALSQQQLQILTALWLTLKKGGELLYVTCSILPAENEFVIARFCDQQDDVEVMPIAHPCAQTLDHGQQLLPGDANTDGFYFSLLRKH